MHCLRFIAEPYSLLIIAYLAFTPSAKLSFAQELDAKLGQELQAEIQPLLSHFCYDCHRGESAEASVDLSIYQSLDRVRSNPSQWEQVRGLVRIGAMPPPDADSQPNEAERKKISEWTRRALHDFDCSEPNPPPPITVRRLNSMEYDRTICDLFGVAIAPSKVIGFVSDDVGNGFDNQGEVLSISPLSLEKYVKAAEWITQQVIELDPNKLREQVTASDPIQPGKEFATSFPFADGEYEISVKLRFNGRQPSSIPAEIYLDEDLLDETEVRRDGKSLRWKRTLTRGDHTIRVRFVDGSGEKSTMSSSATLNVDRISVVGPKEGRPPMPRAHQRLMIATPNAELSSSAAAGKIIKAFLPKAYRRPATKFEVDRILGIFSKAEEGGASFNESIQFAIQAALVSPEFLFRIEPSSDPTRLNDAHSKLSADSGTAVVVKINDYELASRLSYFLWSTMPDDRLFELANKGQLSKPQVLDAEIERMLDDPKSDALVAGFFDQWLGMRNLQTVSVDENTFKVWSNRLSEAMAKETFLFCRELLHEGSLRDLLDADYTYVNPRLAEFYNLPFDGEDPSQMYLGSNRYSDFDSRLGSYRDEERWIRVDLPKYRRGLLTHASILTLTSNPTRTSPVKRGKWVLENILGDPPPPAPPGVPPLDEENAKNKERTLRQRLEIHRANPSCASCHRVLDPIGLGLENFDAIGRWRTIDDGSKIDSAGEFADGRKFNGSRELLAHLQSDQDKINRHFATQLLVYALGRGLTRGDSCIINSIVSQAAQDDLRVASFIRGVIMSQPFLNVGIWPDRG